MADSLRDDGLVWLEEPVWPPEDCDGLARGAPASASRSRLARTSPGGFGFKSLIDAGAIDIAQPSVTKIGGIGEMLRGDRSVPRPKASRSRRTARISDRA